MRGKPAYTLRISPALKRAASRLAEKDGVSLDYWINIAIAQKLGSEQTVAYYRRHFGKEDAADLKAVLDRVPDRPPMAGDELPADLPASFRPHRR